MSNIAFHPPLPDGPGHHPPPHHHGPPHHQWGNGLLDDDDLHALEHHLGDADTAAAVHRALFYAPPEIGALGKLVIRALAGGGTTKPAPKEA